MADEQKAAAGEEGVKKSADNQAELRKDIDQMLQSLNQARSDSLSKEDLKRLKDEAFGPLTFWVVETRAIQVRGQQRSYLGAWRV